MFYQNDVYVMTEYGTRECPEEREPCGAFYGLPCSGEIEDVSQYDRLQITEAMPDTNLLHTEWRHPRPKAEDTPNPDKRHPIYEEHPDIEKLRREFLFTYNTHAILRRRFKPEEYVEIRMKLYKNNGIALTFRGRRTIDDNRRQSRAQPQKSY